MTGMPNLDVSLSSLLLQVCLLECEGHVSSSLTWEVCKRAVKIPRQSSLPGGGALSKRAEHELELTPLDLNSDDELLQSATAQRFREGDRDEETLEQRSAQYDSSLLESSEEGEGLQGLALRLVDEEGKAREGRDVEGGGQLEEDEDEGSEAITLSKRFGGFLRGRHGYRKLIGSPVRSLQKRYGGFIGVRKSARKWNSQKRVNQLLKQYLGMRSNRSGRFYGVPVTRVWRQNQLWCVPVVKPAAHRLCWDALSQNPAPGTSVTHVFSSSLKFKLWRCHRHMKNRVCRLSAPLSVSLSNEECFWP